MFDIQLLLSQTMKDELSGAVDRSLYDPGYCDEGVHHGPQNHRSNVTVPHAWGGRELNAKGNLTSK